MAGGRNIELRFRGDGAPLNVDDYRRLARRALPKSIWAYVDSAAEDLVTLNENRAAFARWRLRQRTLTGSGGPDLSTTIEGTELSMPIMVAPTGLNGLSHWRADIAVASAAEQAGTRLVASSASSYSIEEIGNATREDHWFQLYPWGDRELMASLMTRAKNAGIRVLVVTTDVPVTGNREGERRFGMGVPLVLTPRRALDAALHPAWLYGFVRYQRCSIRNLMPVGGVRAGAESTRRYRRQLIPLGWEDLAWIREQWSGPLYVKGILDPADAERALDIGANGIVVSNHGGRQLEQALATLDALPEIVNVASGRGTVLIDGGIRRGSDVIKALCLGADGCLIGRAAVYGLAAAGERGVAAVLEIFRQELRRALILMGCQSVRDLGPSWILPAPGTPAGNAARAGVDPETRAVNYSQEAER